MKYSDPEVTNFGVEYDPESVMHYSPFAFSKNGKPAIELSSRFSNSHPANGVRMGQRNGLSDKDIIKVNRMYECT